MWIGDVGLGLRVKMWKDAAGDVDWGYGATDDVDREGSVEEVPSRFGTCAAMETVRTGPALRSLQRCIGFVRRVESGLGVRCCTLVVYEDMIS